jgi:hypothetical protein
MFQSYVTIIRHLKYQNTSKYVIGLLVTMAPLQIVPFYATFPEITILYNVGGFTRSLLPQLYMLLTEDTVRIGNSFITILNRT